MKCILCGTIAGKVTVLRSDANELCEFHRRRLAVERQKERWRMVAPKKLK